MKVTIAAEVPDDLADLETIHYLLNDALAEFCKARESAWEYVRLRYPQGYLGDHANDARKIAEVKNRVALAYYLRNNNISLPGDNYEDLSGNS